MAVMGPVPIPEGTPDDGPPLPAFGGMPPFISLDFGTLILVETALEEDPYGSLTAQSSSSKFSFIIASLSFIFLAYRALSSNRFFSSSTFLFCSWSFLILSSSLNTLHSPPALCMSSSFKQTLRWHNRHFLVLLPQ